MGSRANNFLTTTFMKRPGQVSIARPISSETFKSDGHLYLTNRVQGIDTERAVKEETPTNDFCNERIIILVLIVHITANFDLLSDSSFTSQTVVKRLEIGKVTRYILVLTQQKSAQILKWDIKISFPLTADHNTSCFFHQPYQVIIPCIRADVTTDHFLDVVSTKKNTL